MPTASLGCDLDSTGIPNAVQVGANNNATNGTSPRWIRSPIGPLPRAMAMVTVAKQWVPSTSRPSSSVYRCVAVVVVVVVVGVH